MNWLDWLICCAAFAAALRILMFSRQGRQFKRGISILAYILIVGCSWLGWALLSGQINNHDIPVLLIPVFLVAVLVVFYARGNVSLLYKWLIGRT